MKHICLLFFLMTSITVMAQETIPQDTTIFLNGRKMVIKENNGKIKVKMYEAKSNNDTIENAQVFEGVYLDGRSIEQTTIVSVPFVKKNKRYRFDPHYPAIYVGFDKLSKGVFQYSAGVPQIGSKSWEWGINPFCGGIALTPNNHWGVTAALGIARIVHKLDDNFGFEKIDGITVCQPAPEGVDYQKAGYATGLSAFLSAWNGKPSSEVAVHSLRRVLKWNGASALSQEPNMRVANIH